MRINHQTYIKASPEKVYATLTTAEGWNAWFTDHTALHLDENGKGKIILRWSNYGVGKENIEDGGDILAAVPNKWFSFQWSPGNKPTTVKFELRPSKDGTLLFLEEEGYTISPEDLTACVGCAVGWGEALVLLKMYLEFGIVCKEDYRF
ncbi:SRPBCC domain-containing protein [Cytobacillus depressus]|uniref:SRPBCC domain-containing protein n=1 Tax=Cytobacillus depressus TaxID=1602942 RepID=A0A6L3V1Y5_9BACI|nr:SRPBCC domain-containing protein [Cytobacillus depressus]KAB2329979.1 SRPBCC domain-containing protein [Cytobacillus depressus]